LPDPSLNTDVPHAALRPGSVPQICLFRQGSRKYPVAQVMLKTQVALVALLLISGCATRPPENPCSATSNCSAESNEDRTQPVTFEDLAILDRASELLSDARRWNRNDTRQCPKDAPTVSLFCALQQATIEVLGSYDHRRVALQEVRFAVDEALNGREVEHRLTDFNNLPETTIEQVRKVIADARSRVVSRM
jgi:hypothetical protein